MKTHNLTCIAISIFLLFPKIIQAEEGEGQRDIYLTYHKDLILHTTDENIQIVTKTDPAKQKDNAILDFEVLIPKKWTKEIYLNLHVYSEIEGKKTFIGCFVLKNMGRWKAGVGGKDHEAFSFTLTKKYFSHSYLSFETETESLTVHLCKKK